MKLKNVLISVCLAALTACRATTAEPAETPKPKAAYAPPPAVEKTWDGLMDGLLYDGGGDSCISPISIKLALAMAYVGAENDTAELLSELFGATPDEMSEWAAAYLDAARAYDGGRRGERFYLELRVANSFWLRKGWKSDIAKSFADTLKNRYYAESGEFDKKPDPINKWVSGATNGKIKNILAEIAPDAVAYIVNALYFKAQWENEFMEALTRKGEFTNINGETVTVDMLRGGANAYIDTEDFVGMTKILYGGFAFTAVMPKNAAELTFAAVTAAMGQADDGYTAIRLTMPKFGFETSVKFSEGAHPEFDALFAHGGMNGALSASARIDDLLISQVIHKTTFTLSETGIEASAATVVEAKDGAAMVAPKETEITFDRPFAFLLTDAGGEVLFFGKATMLK